MTWDEHAEEHEGTVMVPRPGGRPAASDSAPAGAAPLPAGELAAVGSNPLVAAATPALALAARLRSQGDGTDPESLRERSIRAIQEFNGRAQAAGITGQTLRYANYLLCATLDDVVLNSPWGSHSTWATRNLVSTFHTDVVGGERVFELVERLQQDPANRRDLLELAYFCLSLGFEGRTRVSKQGQSELWRTREGMYGALKTVSGAASPDLSPHWQGVVADLGARRRGVPVWVGATVAAALLVLAFLGLSWLLNDASDLVQAAVAEPLPAVALALPKVPEPPVPVPVVKPPEPPAAPVETGGARISKFLEREIAEGLVQVTESQNEIVVRLRSQGMFASGSATLEDGFLPRLKRVAEAINGEPGRVIVAGHTDSVPIQGSMKLRFPSNFHLSKARADAVVSIMTPYLKESGRLTAEGRADTEPVATNATAEGRAANRRIDLILIKPAASAL